MNCINVASIVFVNPEGNLIFQKRDDKPDIRNPNMITAWGGACENGETPIRAAIREVHEETNLKPSESDLEIFGEYPRDYKIDDRQVVNYVYLLRDIDEKSLEIYEGQGWVLVNPVIYKTDSLYTKLTNELIADYVSNSRQKFI